MIHFVCHSEEFTFDFRKTEKATGSFCAVFGKLILMKGSGKNGSKNAILKSYFIDPGERFGGLN